MHNTKIADIPFQRMSAGIRLIVLPLLWFVAFSRRLSPPFLFAFH
jgi:hypothetical protein